MSCVPHVFFIYQWSVHFLFTPKHLFNEQQTPSHPGTTFCFYPNFQKFFSEALLIKHNPGLKEKPWEVSDPETSTTVRISFSSTQRKQAGIWGCVSSHLISCADDLIGRVVVMDRLSCRQSWHYPMAEDRCFCSAGSILIWEGGRGFVSCPKHISADVISAMRHELWSVAAVPTLRPEQKKKRKKKKGSC